MRVYLVRHASHSLLGRVLCGRAVDVGLNAEGNRQARALGEYFERERTDVLQTSPQRRARETAAVIGVALECMPEIAAPLDEHDAGDWAGRGFETLANDARWRAWNERRGSVRPPQGESMRELQQRVIAHVEAMRTQPIDSAIMVSHADPIRAAIMHYRGIGLDDFLEVQVEPANIHLLQFSETDVEVSSISIMASA
jgi:broad specificity phosphatase PhoE